MKRIVAFLISFLLLCMSIVNADNGFNKYHPMVIDKFLLGGVKDGLWLSSSDIARNINGGERYKIYSFDKYLGDGTGTKIKYSNSHKFEMVDIDSVLISRAAIAISGEWNALPRMPRMQSNTPVYKKIIQDILAQNGLPNAPICIQQNYRIDLNGDGTDEVLIKAEYIKKIAPTSDKGTYSLLLLRKMNKGKVKTIFLVKDIFSKSTDYGADMTTSNSIYSLSDVNGDGKIEIILSCKYYEGLIYNLYEIKNDQAKIVLSCGEGA